MVDGLVAGRWRSRWRRSARCRTRTQITRHDCVEGWSAIGKWTGVPLGCCSIRRGLRAGGALHRLPLRRRLSAPAAIMRAIDLIDAFHPQTILAWR